MTRYLPGGTLDSSFGSAGKVLSSLGGTFDYGSALVLQPDGKIVVAGGSDSSFAIARYQPTGFLDVSFGNAGKVIGSTPASGETAVARQADGALVAAGYVGSNFALMRFLDTQHTTEVLAATGNWTFQYPVLPSGTFSFDDLPTNVFGNPVNLGTSVGSMPYDGAIPASNGWGGMITLDGSGQLTFHMNGTYACALDGCFSGDPNTVFAIATTMTGGGLPAGVVYRFDSSPAWNPGTSHFEGRFTLTAIAPANTDVGEVTVSGPGVTVHFDDVTAAGATLVNVLSGPPGPLPANFEAFTVDSAGVRIPTFFDITTSAQFMGNITICLPHFDPLVTIPELLHFVPPTGTPELVSLTDTGSALCGTVTSLSPFALVVEVPDDAGFVPPDASAGNCEAKVAKAVAKLAGAIVKCHVKAADAATEAASFDEEACEAAERGKYDRATAALSGCPACTVANLGAVRDRTESVLDSLNGAAYCAGSVPLGGDEFGFVAESAQEGKCEDKFAKHMSRLFGALVACHTKSSRAALAGTSVDEEACEAPVKAKYDEATRALTGCGSCTADNAATVRDQVERLLDRDVSGDVYCAGTMVFP
jgi:uncharacterized delta-60 repeat protein